MDTRPVLASRLFCCLLRRRSRQGLTPGSGPCVAAAASCLCRFLPGNASFLQRGWHIIRRSYRGPFSGTDRWAVSKGAKRSSPISPLHIRSPPRTLPHTRIFSGAPLVDTLSFEGRPHRDHQPRFGDTLHNAALDENLPELAASTSERPLSPRQSRKNKGKRASSPARAT